MNFLKHIALILTFITNAHHTFAYETAEVLWKLNPISLVSVPNTEPGQVDILGVFQFGNSCVSANTKVVVEQEFNPQTQYMVFGKDSELNPSPICNRMYDPVTRFIQIATNLIPGMKININHQTFEVKPVVPAFCTEDLCPDGSSRDPFTCECQAI